jgi:hypothetical protein
MLTLQQAVRPLGTLQTGLRLWVGVVWCVCMEEKGCAGWGGQGRCDRIYV